MSLPRRFKFLLIVFVLLPVLAPAVWRVFWARGPVSVFNDRVPSAHGKIWTITGSADSNVEAFVDTYGSFQATQDSYSIHYFVYDRNSRKLYSPHIKKPGKISRELLDGYLPAPRVVWEDTGVSVESAAFVSGDPDTCYSAVTVKNNTPTEVKDLSLFVAAVTYGVHGRFVSSGDISYSKAEHTVFTDGNVLIGCDQEPDAFGAVVTKRDISDMWDITSYIMRGRLPSTQSVKAGLSAPTSAALRYDIRLKPGESRKLTFKSPMVPVPAADWRGYPARSIAYGEALQGFKNEWVQELNRVELDLPDRRYGDCFRASLAYLMILSDGGAPRPGATIYQPMWVRDFAYIADALYFAGRADLLPGGFKHLRTLQLPNGGYLARTGGMADDEYDAPGQAIYAQVQDYRRSGDLKRLAGNWASIRKSCEYLRTKRLENKRTDDMRKGILPPSMSAEDLGNSNEQHYWDDFWAYRGLIDAAYAADSLGYGSDSAWIRAEAQNLLNAMWGSIRAVTQKHGIDYIPNGPDDVTTSSMARGTTSGLWPCGMLDPRDPLVRSSFDVYWEKWVAPYNGGFKHNGEEFWPYAGLDLAQCYLELGEYERAGDMLRWAIDHDPTEGFYSWPEGMNTENFTLANGDMPHGWMCASYILLLRNMLVRESGEDLMLASGVPEEWLAPGKEIRIRDFPTQHGNVSYRLSSGSDRLRLTLEGNARPRSYALVLPRSVSARGLVVDGGAKPVQNVGKVVLPAGVRKIEIKVSR